MTEQTKVDLEQLLAEIRRGFYAGDTVGKYFKDEPMLGKAITWPATWLRARGLTWTGDRYFSALRGLLAEIGKHGATGEIKYFPGYLLKCFQDHFAHNGDAYCDEGRQLRNGINVAMSAIQFSGQSGRREDTQTIDVLAAAHALLATRPRAPRGAKPETNQIEFL
jgi:hypothetical protein